MNRYDEALSSLQSSMEEDHDNTKHFFGGGGGATGQGNPRGSILHISSNRRQQALRKIPSMKVGKN